MARLVLGTDINNTGTSALVRDVSPELYRSFSVDENGVLTSDTQCSKLCDFSKVKTIDNNTGQPFCRAYQYNSNLKEVKFSSLEAISGTYVFNEAFQYCTSLEKVDFSKLKQILSGQSNFGRAFYNCTNLQTVDFSSLILLNGMDTSFQSTFSDCTSLETVDFHNLAIINNDQIASAFNNCTSLKSVDLSNLTIIKHANRGSCSSLFNHCTNFESVNLDNLAIFDTNNQNSYMFNQTKITKLNFPLAYTTKSLNTTFDNMLYGCSNVTVHFPAEWENDMSTWSSIQNGMGGTNTTILWDLPNRRIINLNLNGITDFQMSSVFKDYTKITTVNLNSLKAIRYGAYAFENCTSLTNVNLNEVERFNANMQYAFNNCTSLVNISFPKLMNNSFAYDSGIGHMFNNCTSLKSVDLSNLCCMVNDNYFRHTWNHNDYVFNGCTSLTDVDLSSLFAITSGYMFNDCTSLRTLSFPSLMETDDTYISTTTLLTGCTGVTLHFPSNLQSKLSGVNYGYPNFGGTDTVVLFDLPATRKLRCANSIDYVRNPKYDTQTSLAWRKKEQYYRNCITTSPVYTSTTSDPQVGDTIYNNPECTEVVTTITSIQ